MALCAVKVLSTRVLVAGQAAGRPQCHRLPQGSRRAILLSKHQLPCSQRASPGFVAQNLTQPLHTLLGLAGTSPLGLPPPYSSFRALMDSSALEDRDIAYPFVSWFETGSAQSQPTLNPLCSPVWA